MAKTKAAKKRGVAMVLRFISDPSHGWAEVPTALCRKLRIGTAFTKRGKFCYLEEDDEATLLDRALKRHGISVTFAGHDVDDFSHWLDGEQWPYIPAAVYGEDATLVIAALDSMATQMKRLRGDATYTAEDRAMWSQQFSDCRRLALMFSTMRGEVNDEQKHFKR